MALLASCGVDVCDCADAEFVKDEANAKKCLELSEEMGTEEFGKAIIDCAKEDAK